MIAFDLACDCGYQFEGWFQSHEALENQIKKGLLLCPHCNQTNIRKLMSPVAFHSSSATICHSSPKNTMRENNFDQTAKKIVQAVQEYVEKNFEDVGTKLASEALKIHYGLEEPRNIRGVATTAEEKMLENEGVKFLKIPLSEKTN